MPYPVVQPAARTYDHGNYPVKTYNAQNGAEVRLLYGSKRYNLQLQLTYNNISDDIAEEFLQHFDETFGTYKTFQFSTEARVALLAGWKGGAAALQPPQGVDWRYAQAPQLVNVRPGISTVNVSLIGVI